MNAKQLQALKPGDSVAYESRSFDYKTHSTVARWCITTVKEVLATQIKTADGKRWKQKNGWEWGSQAGSLHRPHLQEATPERIKAAAEADEHEGLVRRMRSIDWDKHDLATLRRVAAEVEGRGLTDDEIDAVERALVAEGEGSYERAIIVKLRREPA
jgi:hypothetical protein